MSHETDTFLKPLTSKAKKKIKRGVNTGIALLIIVSGVVATVLAGHLLVGALSGVDPQGTTTPPTNAPTPGLRTNTPTSTPTAAPTSIFAPFRPCPCCSSWRGSSPLGSGYFQVCIDGVGRCQEKWKDEDHPELGCYSETYECRYKRDQNCG